MRSDREEIPEGYTKEQADQAEIAEAEAIKQRSMQRGAAALAAPTDCQTYWPEWRYQVCGQIRVKYDSLGGSLSFLLLPTSNELTNPDGIGKRNTFMNGPIYWHPNAGAHPVVNHFHNKWSQHGFDAGFLRYPTTDEIVNADGVGRHQDFQGGSIYWHPTRGWASIGGAILDKWRAVGADTGFLGYPSIDELPLPDGQGRMNRFEHGVIYWSPTTGAHPVSGVILQKWTQTGFEGGPFGYPTQDEQNSAQQFQNGTISIFTNVADPLDPGATDWDEETIDETTCDWCGNDDQFNVSGPGNINVPQPPATGPGTFAGRTSEPESEVEDLPLDPEQELPSCDTIVPDPAAPADEVTFCSGGEPSTSPEARAGGTWTTAVQPYCNDLPQRQWAGDRSYQCMWRKDYAYLTSNQTGAQIGEVQYVQEHEVRTKWNNRSYEARSVIHILHAFGAGTAALYGGNASCTGTGSCTPTGDTGIHSHPMTDSTSIMDYDVTSPVLASGSSQQYTINTTFDFTHTGAKPPKTWAPTGRFPTVRCDTDANNKQGCVVLGATPILDMTTRPNAAAHAQHIGDAQRSGLPGAPGVRPLTRSTNATVIQNNRNSSCNKVPGPRPSGMDCDEYPFASTYEGGFTPGQGATARTYPGCGINLTWVTEIQPGDSAGLQGISMCQITRKANRSGGGVLTWFFKRNRMFDNEQFYVRGS